MPKKKKKKQTKKNKSSPAKAPENKQAEEEGSPNILLQKLRPFLSRSSRARQTKRRKSRKEKKSLVLAGKEGAELVNHEEGLSKTFVRRLQNLLSSKNSVAFNEQTLLQP